MSFLERLTKRIPEQPISKKTATCSSCIGACCMKSAVLELTTDERAYLEDRNTQLTPVAVTGDLIERNEGYDFYRLDSDCGNLDPETRACNDYSNRPQICRDFVEGDFMCEVTRDLKAKNMADGVVDLPMPGFGSHIEITLK